MRMVQFCHLPETCVPKTHPNPATAPMPNRLARFGQVIVGGRLFMELAMKSCAYCGKPLVRKRFSNGVLESQNQMRRRKFCDRRCMARKFDQKPETSWAGAHEEARSIKSPGPCERCGKPDARDVHHKNGNWQDNSPNNLERICRSCHIREHRGGKRCVVCGSPHKGLGFCDKHYQRFKKWGHPMIVKENQFTECRNADDPIPTQLCLVPWCGKKRHAQGYCSRHAMQARRGRMFLSTSEDLRFGSA